MGRLICEVQDLTHLQWTRQRKTSGTAGSFLKAWDVEGGKRVYYKLSNFEYGKGVVGYECVNELIADRLLELLRIEHLSYDLIRAVVEIDGNEYTTWLCKSYDYKNPGESKIALDTFYEMERRDKKELPFDFCVRMGWGGYLFDMLLVDYLILNRDRHGANIEVLRDSKTFTYRPAPLFDHGISMFFRGIPESNTECINVLEENKVQCFVGGSNTFENIKYCVDLGLKEIEAEKKRINCLKESDKDGLFSGLYEVMSSEHIDITWEMIWKRWKNYENLCNSR